MTKSAAEVRREFIEFFRQRGHVVVPSAPVVPHDDPTLLFTNAGMNQFKPLFLGQADPKSEFGRLKRAANTQKCIRAGGKHNDLDDVGHDTYHHTFFEMLGNWSFGDYFKREAIAWAWELLTGVWGLDKRRLHATYFGGDPDEGLEPDLEARELWLRATDIDPAHVHAGGKKDNFWEMGETGPCGPCSEIHIDRTPDASGGRLVNAGDPRVIEIWNLVFIQFNRGADGRLAPLPARHVDTGMGFERVTAVLQGRESNYDTDVFTPILAAIGQVTGAPPYGGRLETDGQAAERAAVMRDVAYRVIADHIRCLVFAITDGAVPDKEGRGYVLRRILRRAVRYGWQYLDIREPFLCRLVDTVVQSMGDAFPELRANPGHVGDVLHEEEESFGRTLERGLALFDEAAEYARTHHRGTVRGEDAFRLHDTYGFPIDLTQIMAAERGLTVDIGEYERLMEEARARARAAGRGFQTGGAAVPPELVAPFGPTDSAAKYTCEQTEARLRAIIRFGPDGPAVSTGDDSPAAGEALGLVFDRTCFYAEAGGQVGDRGEVHGDSLRFAVQDTQQIGATVVHFGTLERGTPRIGQPLTLAVDARRRRTMQNHTATHVLNWALREVLGDHVQQKGSLVDPDKTRFDFAHPRAVTPAELERIEQLVVERIRADLPVHHRVVPQEQALRINGLRAVFGERYPDQVRVLSIGVPVADLLRDPARPEWRNYSVEFCGGTHLQRTGQIGHFAIIHEEAVAKGIRRIVAVSGEAARQALERGAALLRRAEEVRHGPPEDVPAGLAELQAALAAAAIPAAQRARLRAALEELQQVARRQQKAEAADAAGLVGAHLPGLLRNAERVGATAVIVGELPEVPVEQLKHGADRLKQKCGSAAVLLGMRSAGKAVLLAALTPDLVTRGLKAGEWARAVAPLVGGAGGGPPTMAQAGGRQPERLEEALNAGREWIRGRLR